MVWKAIYTKSENFNSNLVPIEFYSEFKMRGIYYSANKQECSQMDDIIKLDGN